MQEMIKNVFSSKKINVSDGDLNSIATQLEAIDQLRHNLDESYLNDSDICLYHRPVRGNENE